MEKYLKKSNLAQNVNFSFDPIILAGVEKKEQETV